MRLHLVDGTYELFRAHYSRQPPRRAPDGREVKATIGLVSSLLRLLADEAEAVTHIGIAFDNPVESFRNDLFDGYKTGEGIEPELASQFDGAEDAAAVLGLVVWRMDRWEADDALATAAHRWRDDVEQVRILTPDKDLGQCVRGSRVVQVDRMRERSFDEDGIRAARGVSPNSIPDYLALVGDSADGIPGIPGFGAKSAATLLSRYGTVEAIPDDAARWDVKVRGAPRLASTLASMREEVALYKQLATLVEDVPLRETLDDLRWRGVPRAPFLAWCDAMGADRLRRRPHRFRE